MTTTEDMGETRAQEREETNESLGDTIERMMADVEKRVSHLLQDLHHAARGSAAFEGGERDARRLMDWLDAKAQELRTELDQLGKDAAKAAKKAKDTVKDTVGRKPHDEPPASTPNSPEDAPNADDA